MENYSDCFNRQAAAGELLGYVLACSKEIRENFMMTPDAQSEYRVRTLDSIMLAASADKMNERMNFENSHSASFINQSAYQTQTTHNHHLNTLNRNNLHNNSIASTIVSGTES